MKACCVTCARFFILSAAESECSNADVCLDCLRVESEATRAVLAARGIVLLAAPW